MKEYNKTNIPLAKALRKNQTPWERKLWFAFLREYPVRFQRQKAIGAFIVDFYCAKAELVIELDGGGHYQEGQEREDLLRTQTLEELNLKILRFCNLDIDNNFKGVCERIDFEVRQRLCNNRNPRLHTSRLHLTREVACEGKTEGEITKNGQGE